MRYLARALCMAAVLIASSIGGPAKAGDDVTVEVRGLRIVGKGYGEGMKGLRPFNWSPGTTLAVLVTAPAGGLLKLDKDASKVDRLVDDKGTDLLQPGTSKFSRPGFGHWARISKDGKACMVEVTGNGVPAKEAKEITATGTMVFKSATKKQTFRQKNVALQPGTKVAAGRIPLEITKVGKPSWGSDPVEVTFKTNTDLGPIAEIRFLGPDGKAIKSRGSGGSSFRTGGAMTVHRSYRLAKKATVVTIEIDYWMDLKVLKVPLSIKSSVGM